MNVEISGRNYEVGDRIRELVEKKLDKVKKYFEDIIEVRCVLQVAKYRNLCEVIIIGKTYDVKASQEGDTMEEAVQSAFDHLKRQAEKNRKKVTDHRRGKESPASWEINVIEPASLRPGNGGAKTTAPRSPRIIKTNNITIRPMSVEQAALMLDDSKNEFIVFRDLDTDRVTVIYRRKDNNFGMIAPEF